MTAESIATAAYIVAFLLFILSLAGLSKHETSRLGVLYGIAGMTIALAATIGLVVQHVAAVAVRTADRRGRRRRRDRAVAGACRRDDRHAGADRGTAQLRRSRRRARRLERLLRGRGARRVRAVFRLVAEDSPRRGVHRHLHRRRHVHRLDRGEPEAVREDQVCAADAAGQELHQPRGAGRVRGAHDLLRRAPEPRPARRGHGRVARRSAGTWSRRSAAATCPSWCRC